MGGSHKEVQFNLIRRKQRLTPTDFLICRGSFALFDKLEFICFCHIDMPNIYQRLVFDMISQKQSGFGADLT